MEERIMSNEIKASKKIDGVDKEATILYDFGGDLDGAVILFGKEVVYANFVRSSVITAQAAMRRFIEDGKSQDEIASKMAGWKPGVPLERVVDPIAATLNKFAAMTPEEQIGLINKLKAMKQK
jgi:hypothetical protein